MKVWVTFFLGINVHGPELANRYDRSRVGEKLRIRLNHLSTIP